MGVAVKARKARQHCTCAYMGRRTAQLDNAFVQKVIDWPEGTSRQSKATVTFRWQDAAGTTLDRDVAADHAWKRGLLAPPLTDGGAFDETMRGSVACARRPSRTTTPSTKQPASLLVHPAQTFRPACRLQL